MMILLILLFINFKIYHLNHQVSFLVFSDDYKTFLFPAVEGDRRREEVKNGWAGGGTGEMEWMMN